MDKWKILEKDDLPPDILNGNYKFEYDNDDGWDETRLSITDMLEKLVEGDIDYRYRKPEPKQPTHEEIMTKWWKMEDNSWCKVSMLGRLGSYYIFNHGDYQDYWFVGKESADIPPEAN